MEESQAKQSMKQMVYGEPLVWSRRHRTCTAAACSTLMDLSPQTELHMLPASLHAAEWGVLTWEIKVVDLGLCEDTDSLPLLP